MKMLLAKILFALTLWILSMFFGLLVPWLLLRSRIRKQRRPSSSSNPEAESLLNSETESNHVHSSYQTMNSSTRRINTENNFLSKFRDRVLRYDVISFINCCCAGLFLGICFLELLPESKKDVSEIITKTNTKTSLPVTEFLVSIGLIMVMLIEQIVHATCIHNGRRSNSRRKTISVSTQNQNSDSSVYTNEPSQANVCFEDDGVDNIAVQYHDAQNGTRSIVLVAMLSVHSIFEGLALGLETTFSELLQLFIAISIHKSVISFGLGMRLFDTFLRTRVIIAVIASLLFCSGSPFGSVIGIIVSLNSSNSTDSGIGNNTITIAPGISTPDPGFNDVTSTMYATAVLQCLATGTFLYVTFIEVIPLEFAHVNHDQMIDEQSGHVESQSGNKLPIKPMIKLGALLFGFLIVTGLQFV